MKASDASAGRMQPGDPSGPRGRSGVRGILLLVALFVLAVGPAIFVSQRLLDRGVEIPGSQPFDEVNYHLPVIREMAAQWPDVDLVQYRSATSPGYHLVMAAVVKTLGDSELLLRLFNSCLSLALLLAAAWPMIRLGRPGVGLACAAAFGASSYFLGGAIYLTTDNAAMLFVVLGLGLVVFGPGLRRGGSAEGGGRGAGLLLAGVAAALAVGVRQIHVWLAGPIGLVGLAALLAPGSAAGGGRARTLLCAAVGAALPLALLAWFVSLWGGLMPPAYRDLHARSFNLALPALTLSVAGVFALFFLFAAAGASARRETLVRASIVGAAVGLAAALLPATAFNPEAGRHNGWLWQAAAKVPAVADRSLLLLALAPVGGAAIGALWAMARHAGAARGRAATMLIFALLAWAAAHSANTQAWLRYVEPMVLLTMGWLACLARPADGPAPSRPGRITIAERVPWLGPATLACSLLLMSAAKVYLPIVRLALQR